MENPSFDAEEIPPGPEIPKRVDEPDFAKRRIHYKLFTLIKQMVVEPIIFAHLTVLLMTALCAEDLMLDRACRVNLNFSTEACDALKARDVGNFSAEETAVQKTMSVIATWRSGIEYSLPSLIVLILGSWSDRSGRRLPLMLPQIGTVLKIIGLVICSYIGSVDANLIAIVNSVPSTATGGFPLFSMAYHSYIGDTTPKKHRTARFGIANVFSTLGVSAGSAIGGFLLTKTTLGHFGVFQICGAVEVLVLVYTLFFVRNGRVSIQDETSPVLPDEPGLKSICNPRAFWKPFTLLYKTKGRRIKLLLILISHFLAASPYYGEPVVLYLFTRYQLGWNAGGFGLFSMVKNISQTAGIFFAMSVLSSWMQMSDPLLGALSSISQLSSCFIYAFAKTDGMMYTAAGVDVLNGAMAVVARSMASKLVESNEQGKLHSLFAISDSVNPIISNVLYGGLYRATLDVLPGAFFLLSGADTVLPLLIFLYFMYAKV